LQRGDYGGGRTDARRRRKLGQYFPHRRERKCDHPSAPVWTRWRSTCFGSSPVRIDPTALPYQAVPVSADTQNQFTIRLDHHINQRQNFSFYYYFTNDANFQPFYDFQASGANIPGFGANVGSRYQQFNPSHTWTISNSLINEARFTYMREGQLTFQHPQTTNLVQDSCSLGRGAGRLFQRHF
jgi:hypothetical protein